MQDNLRQEKHVNWSAGEERNRNDVQTGEGDGLFSQLAQVHAVESFLTDRQLLTWSKNSKPFNRTSILITMFVRAHHYSLSQERQI
jgi:hypothetical protein